MKPLLAKTLFTNKYNLSYQLKALPTSDIELWIVWDFDDRVQRLLYAFTGANEESLETWRQCTTRYRQVDSVHLIPILTSGISSDSIPYIVTDIDFSTSYFQLNNENLINFIRQMLSAFDALHDRHLTPLFFDTNYIDFQVVTSNYRLLPVVQPLSDDGQIDKNRIISIVREKATDLPIAFSLIKFLEQHPNLTLAQIKNLLDTYILSQKWELPTPIDEYIEKEEIGDLSISVIYDSSSDDTLEQDTQHTEPKSKLWLTTLIFGIFVVCIVSWYFYNKSSNINFLRKNYDYSSAIGRQHQYEKILRKGTALMQQGNESNKTLALNVFKSADSLQKLFSLNDSLAKKICDTIITKADERYALTNVPAMYEAMDIPLSYYRLAAILQDTPELQRKIKECTSKLQKASKP